VKQRKTKYALYSRDRRPSPLDLEGLDKGIRKPVEVLRANGIETIQSCQGGKGHSSPDPMVQFCGTVETGFRAVSVCLAFGLPIAALRRVWDVFDHEPVGPHWEITFREQVY
jgi:hypothetical protein